MLNDLTTHTYTKIKVQEENLGYDEYGYYFDGGDDFKMYAYVQVHQLCILQMNCIPYVNYTLIKLF